MRTRIVLPSSPQQTMCSGVLESSRYVVSANVSFGSRYVVSAEAGVFGAAQGVPSWHTNEYCNLVGASSRPSVLSDNVTELVGASIGTTTVLLAL